MRRLICQFPQPPISTKQRVNTRARELERNIIPTHDTIQSRPTNLALPQASVSIHPEPVVLNRRTQPQCFGSCCNGRVFPTFSSLLAHQRRESVRDDISFCRKCSAKLDRKAGNLCTVCRETKILTLETPWMKKEGSKPRILNLDSGSREVLFNPESHSACQPKLDLMSFPSTDTT